jgi:glycerophosphoryl diester phosphodiesterase
MLLTPIVGLALLSSAPAATAVSSTCNVVAHRGDHRAATENSVGSMSKAIADKVGFLELDIRPSAEGRLFLMHDRTVRRTTDGHGRISSMSNREVRALRLDDGSRVPTLQRIMKIAKGSGVHLIVEMKAMAGTASYQDLASQVSTFGPERVVVTSFSRARLDALRSVAPAIRQSLIVARSRPTPAQIRTYGSVTIQFRMVTRDWLRRMPYPVYIYSPDHHRDWHWAPRVYGVVTNRPLAFRRYRAHHCVG